MARICTNCNPKDRWFPTPITQYETYLMMFIKSGVKVPNITGLRKIIKYRPQNLCEITVLKKITK